MAAILARKNTMWYINALITLALMLLFRFLPAPSPHHSLWYGRGRYLYWHDLRLVYRKLFSIPVCWR